MEKKDVFFKYFLGAVSIITLGVLIFAIYIMEGGKTAKPVSKTVNNPTVSNPTTATTNNKTKDATGIELNVPYEVTTSSGVYKITIEGVRKTTERNQFSQISPKEVFFLDYSYENISCDSDLYISSLEFKLMDDNGNVLDTYPVSDDSRNPKAVPQGGKSKGTQGYATTEATQNIKVLFYSNMFNSKPDGQITIPLK